MQIISSNEQDTTRLATDLAAHLRPADRLFLEGDLGMGKSVFARALIRVLTGDADLDVPSPTFTLVQTYETDLAPIWHFDLYRIKASDEIWELGWEDALSDGIMLVEWPSRLQSGLAPRDRLEIGFAPSTEHNGARIITLTPHGQWKDRL